MHRHTTHWSLVGALHAGTVEGCERCLLDEVLAELAETANSAPGAWTAAVPAPHVSTPGVA